MKESMEQQIEKEKRGLRILNTRWYKFLLISWVGGFFIFLRWGDALLKQNWLIWPWLVVALSLLILGGMKRSRLEKLKEKSKS